MTPSYNDGFVQNFTSWHHKYIKREGGRQLDRREVGWGGDGTLVPVPLSFIMFQSTMLSFCCVVDVDCCCFVAWNVSPDARCL